MSTAQVTNSVIEQIAAMKEIAARPMCLMCAPTLYDVDYVINPWMKGNVHASSQKSAMEQWQKLYEAIHHIAAIELVEPQHGSPDMVFTANAGLERNGIVVLSSFFHAERQGEERHFRRWFEEAGYCVAELARNMPFEGEGDALFSTDGSRLWVGYGPRTVIESHERLQGIWPVEVASLHLVDPRFYHLDTCFAPLEGGYVMYYPGAFDAASLGKIEAFYPAQRRIPVNEEDALRFACNAVNIGGTIILNTVSELLVGELKL